MLTGSVYVQSTAATVNCIVTNGNIALSGCEAGVLKLWRMADGQMADSVPLYEGSTAGVTAISCIGPLLVSATLYEVATHHKQLISRLVVMYLDFTPQQSVEQWHDGSSAHRRLAYQNVVV